MSFLSQTLKSLLSRFHYVVPLVEVDSGGSAMNLQGNASGHAFVEAPVPTTHTTLTPNAATDITALANYGFLTGGAGTIQYRTVGDPDTTVTIDVSAGQYVLGQMTKLIAADVVVIGLAQ